MAPIETSKVYASNAVRWGDQGVRAPWTDLGCNPRKRVSGTRSQRAVLVTAADGTERLVAPNDGRRDFYAPPKPKPRKAAARTSPDVIKRYALLRAEPMAQKSAPLVRPHDTVEAYQ